MYLRKGPSYIRCRENIQLVWIVLSIIGGYIPFKRLSENKIESMTDAQWIGFHILVPILFCVYNVA